MANSVSLLLERRTFAALAGLLTAISFLKALRLPNRWAATHFVLNYSQGFVRRGLIGEVTRTLFPSAAFRYWFFVAFAYLSLGATCWVFWRLCRLALTRAGSGPRCAILVFAASPALVLLVHMVGYLDYLGLLLICAFAVVPAAAKSQGLGYGLAALAALLMALIHEAQNVLFMPALLFLLACRSLAEAQRSSLAAGPRPVPMGWSLLSLAGLLALAVGASLYVSVQGDPQRVAALQRWLQERTDFTLHRGAFRALQTGSPLGLLEAMLRFWSPPGALIWWFKGLLMFLPSCGFLVVRGWYAIGTADGVSSRAIAALRALFLVACAAPLSLNLVAWDYARWFALAATNAVICSLGFYAFCRVQPEEDDSAPRVALAAAVVIALGLASDAIFFNRAEVSYYPFIDQWQSLWNLLQTGTLERPSVD